MSGSTIAIRVGSVLGLVLLVLLIIAALWLYTPDKSRTALMMRYGTAADQDIVVAGIRLRVRDTGPNAGPAIIMLHGFGSSLETFEGWAEILSRHSRVIRYDLPGFGLTGADPTGDYSDRRGTDVLAALMDRLGLARASLVGNSMGGRLAWQFAAAYPDRTDKLVLVSPDGFASPGFQYGTAPSVPLLMRALPYGLPEGLFRASLVAAYGDPARLTEPVVARYRDMMLAPGVRGAILNRMGQTVLQDPEPILRRIKAPTLLLWGEDDRMIPIRNADDYLRNIPQAKLVRLPGLGHVPYEEAPDRSVRSVEDFLAGRA